MFWPRLFEDFLFSAYFLKNALNPKMISFQQKKVKLIHKYCTSANGTAFSPKFILDIKVQNSAF